MADTNTPNILLLLPDLGDTFNFATHVEANFSTIDGMMGAVQCTTTTRPSNTYAGQIIYETDSKRYVQNTGTKATPAWTYMSHASLAVTSSAHPTSGVTTGLEIFETDTGLSAVWNGSKWLYPSGQLLYRTVLGAPTSTVRLPGAGSLPQVFTDLKIVISAQSTGTGASGYDDAGMQFNGVTTATYNWNSYFAVQGGGVTTSSGTSVTNMQCAVIWNAHFASAGRGISTLSIPNYSDANSTKQFTSLSAATDGGTAGITQTYSGGNGAPAAAITSVTIVMGIGNFAADSTFSVYGM